MALLTREDITFALSRLGELAAEEEQFVELLVIGGAAMALVYQARTATRDVDAVILAPADAAIVRRLAQRVAHEFGWPGDQLKASYAFEDLWESIRDND